MGLFVCTLIILITQIYADRDSMIRITNLTKRFDNVVLKYPDIIAQKGDFLLICGDSGSGKSTLCEMIAEFITPDAGAIEMDIGSSGLKSPLPPFKKGGVDGWFKKGGVTQGDNVFKHIHYISQFPDHNLIGPTCFEELELWLDSANKGNDSVFIKNKLCEFLLDDYIDMPVWRLSFGKKKALAFCCISAIKRDIWVLDEPFAGLDSDMIVVVKNLCKAFIEGGGIIIATSHTDEDFLDLNTKYTKLSHEGHKGL